MDNIPQHLREAMADAKRAPDRDGASEFGPGRSRNRADVAPLVNRAHRDGVLRSASDVGPRVYGETDNNGDVDSYGGH
jgi:hypothetical protein